MFAYIYMPRLPKKTANLAIPRLTIPSAISNYKKGAKMSLIVYSSPTTPHFSPALKSLLTPSITEPTIVPLNESRKQPALFCVHPITGMSALVFHFLHCQSGSYCTDRRMPLGRECSVSLTKFLSQGLSQIYV